MCNKVYALKIRRESQYIWKEVKRINIYLDTELEELIKSAVSHDK